jgi:hypothetical protein
MSEGGPRQLTCDSWQSGLNIGQYYIDTITSSTPKILTFPLRQYQSTMAKGSVLVNLPDEILVKVLTRLLQHTTEQARRWTEIRGLGANKSYAVPFVTGEYLACEWRLQAQVLRVCKRFNHIGSPVLYANELVLNVDTIQFRVEPDFMRPYLKMLAASRDDAHRLKKASIMIHTPDEWAWRGTYKDGENLDEVFEALALHQPHWEALSIGLNDLTAAARYNTNQETRERLLYGLGRLHAELVNDSADASRDTLIWAILEPRHTYPLHMLHKDLSTYLDRYDLLQADPSQFAGKEKLRQQSHQASESNNEETFYRVADEVVQQVTAVGQSLTSTWQLGDERHDIFESLQKDGRNLLTAKAGKWRGTYVIER